MAWQEVRRNGGSALAMNSTEEATQPLGIPCVRVAQTAAIRDPEADGPHPGFQVNRGHRWWTPPDAFLITEAIVGWFNSISVVFLSI